MQEFLLAIDVTSSGTPEEKLKWAFRMYDVDGNGVIDIQEMTKIVEVTAKLIVYLKITGLNCNIRFIVSSTKLCNNLLFSLFLFFFCSVLINFSILTVFVFLYSLYPLNIPHKLSKLDILLYNSLKL